AAPEASMCNRKMPGRSTSTRCRLKGSGISAAPSEMATSAVGTASSKTKKMSASLGVCAATRRARDTNSPAEIAVLAASDIGQRGLRQPMKRMLSGICVLVAAAFASGAIADDVKTTDAKVADVAGRWQGQSWRLENGGQLTLDIVACGDGWCGIRVMANDTCGGTALKINAGAVQEGN